MVVGVLTPFCYPTRAVWPILPRMKRPDRMFVVLTASLCLALFSTACSSNGGTKPEVKKRPGHVLTGLEGSKPNSPLGETGCYFLSGDGLQAACLHHDLDMGELTTVVSFHNLTKRGRATAKHTIFMGMTGDDREKKGVKVAELAKVNAAFKAGGFAVEGKHMRGDLPVEEDGSYLKWTFEDRSASATKPSVPETLAKNARKCCRFKPTSATWFPRASTAAAVFDVFCNYHADAGKGTTCYAPDMNDETLPRDIRIRFVPFQ